MSRNHVIATLGAAWFALLAIYQLVSSFGFPQFSFLELYDVPVKDGSSFQVPVCSSPETHFAQSESLYLLGVGKADITGYGNI